MMNSLEKIAYIKGMIAGMDYKFEGDGGKLLKELVELLELLSGEVTDLRESLDYTDSEIASVSEDLLRVEDRLYGLSSRSSDLSDFEDEDDDYDDEDGKDFDHMHDHKPEYFVICPACDERLVITMEDLERGSIDCPKCGESLEFDIDDDCGCGHDHGHGHHHHEHDHGHSHED